MLRRYTSAQAAEKLSLDASEVTFLLLHFKEFLSIRLSPESPTSLTDEDLRILQKAHSMVKDQGLDPSTVRTILRSDYTGGSASGDCQGGFLVFGGGRSGNGQSTIIWNLAAALSARGFRATIFDGSVDQGGIGRLLTLANRIPDDSNDWHIRFHSGVQLVRADKLGLQLDGELTDESRQALQEISHGTDFLLVDSGSGRPDNALRYSMIADEVIEVTTPDVGANTDCFAVIRTLKELDPSLRISLLVNRADTMGAAREAYARVNGAARKLGLEELSSIGWINEDDSVRKFMADGLPVVEALPTSPAARSLGRLAEYIGTRLTPYEPADRSRLITVIEAYLASRQREKNSLEVPN